MSLQKQLEELTKGLTVISETDSNIEVLKVKELGFDKFFDRFTAFYDDESAETAAKFIKLQSFLVNNFETFKVLETGEIEKEILIYCFKNFEIPFVLKIKVVET